MKPFMREAQPEEAIEPAVFVYRNLFMAMEHNYLCAVCREVSAVIDCNSGILQPCWKCQKEGWEIRRKMRWFGRR